MVSMFDFQQMLEAVGRADAEMPIHHLRILSAIVSKPGIRQSELAQKVDFTPAAVSRTLTKLREELGFIRHEEDTENRKNNLLYPTASGERFVKGLLDSLQ